MAQATITNYFSNRKRSAVDEVKGKSKVIVLDSDQTGVGYDPQGSIETSKKSMNVVKTETRVFSSDVNGSKPLKVKEQAANRSQSKSSAKGRKTIKRKDSTQSDMKFYLKADAGNPPTKVIESLKITSSVAPRDAGEREECENFKVVVEKHENSPETASEKCFAAEKCTSDESNSLPGRLLPSDERNVDAHVVLPALKMDNCKSDNLEPPKITLSECKESKIDKARKELSLGDIRSKLTRSARLAELKASMSRFEEGRRRLDGIEQAKKDMEEKKVSKPQLNEFNSIQLEVPVSPCKSPMKSPMKSPSKTLAGSRSPAFQRFSSLAQRGTPSLTLPHSYHHLAELFRCVDTVVSLLFNRKEVITFKKLQPAVQEMSRKSFTQNHLAQMISVFPEAYILKQEKLHNFGSPSLQDKYHLVIVPVIQSDSDGNNSGNPSMTPTVLLERRRHFFNKLLDLVKKHHKEFLQSLDPPLQVPTGVLTRWHPEFAVDMVPDVPVGVIPQPPIHDKSCSAKDVLAKARELYSCNPRVEKALESVAQSNGDTIADSLPVQNVKVEVVNPPPNQPPTSPFKSLQLSSALKGIPKALLEKVRARQAANALKAMTRTSAEDKEASQYARLPELARILRNVFVAEKKGALLLETVLEKVGNSYRTTMSSREIEDHLRLLAKAVPGWISFEHLLKTDYVRLSKKGDMNRVIKRLEELAKDKLGSFV